MLPLAKVLRPVYLAGTTWINMLSRMAGDSQMDPSIQEKVAAALSELGQPAPTNFIQTMLMHDGYFVG